MSHAGDCVAPETSVRSHGIQLLPVSAVVATLGRAHSLSLTLRSLARQTAQPRELIIVDASNDNETATTCATPIDGLASSIRHVRARRPGAASQRNEGVQLASQAVVWFFDDDIRFEDKCAERLWAALQSDDALGGVNATIVNQQYGRPGRLSQLLFCVLHGRRELSYAGRCIGPALNLLPEDADSLPEVVAVEWLNTTCTLYRRAALPQPPFPPEFKGYSLMEDVALSLVVGRNWKLANARTARIVHDSQAGREKNDVVHRSRMEVVNRYYLMTNVMKRRSVADHSRFALLIAFSLITSAITADGIAKLPRRIFGVAMGLADIVSSQNSSPEHAKPY